MKKTRKTSTKSSKTKKINKNKLKKELHKLWSLVVRQREQFYCQWCGFNGKLNQNRLNHAHHIVAQSLCGPEGRFDVNNGMTLCFKCHIDKIKSMPDEYIVFRDYYLRRKGFIYSDMKKHYADNRIDFSVEFYNEKKAEFESILSR